MLVIREWDQQMGPGNCICVRPWQVFSSMNLRKAEWGRECIWGLHVMPVLQADQGWLWGSDSLVRKSLGRGWVELVVFYLGFRSVWGIKF